MTRRMIIPIALAALALTTMTVAPMTAHARSKRGVKKLAMKRFDVSSSDVSVIATAKGALRSSKIGAAIVRLKHEAVPVCRLLILDGAPRSAKNVVKDIRLPVCAAYDKDARKASLRRVDFTTRKGAFLANLFSKRMDAIARGVETRRFWGLYADDRSGAKTVFERTSTSFKSQVNKAIDQTETCEPPSFSVSDKPSTLTIDCKTQTTLAGALNTKRSSFRYQWKHGRFARR